MILRILLCLLVAKVVAIDNDIRNFKSRQLQQQPTQTLNYRATYKADFQHALDAFCTADPPVLQVSCHGTAMSLLNTSDPTIICTQLTVAEIDDGTTFECRNMCEGTICDSIYGLGSFGSIFFMCEGDDYQQVDATYTFLGGNDGSCSTSTSTTTFNYHIGRLGVSCPTATGRDFLYDDTFGECRNLGSLGFVIDLADESDDDEYTCITGLDCEGSICTVPFDSFSIYASAADFLDTCVESLVDLTLFPTRSPIATTALNYSSRFEASWAQIYGTAGTQQSCTSDAPSVMITCGDGNSISIINSTDTSINCTVADKSEMMCTANSNATWDTFISVFFDCTGSVVPTAQVTYLESNASCTNNAVAATISNAVTLGVYCDVEGEQFFYYRDLAFECAETDHNFDIVFSMYGYQGSRYICSESTDFEVGSTGAQTIPSVSIITEWQIIPLGCYTLDGQPTGGVAAPPTLPPVAAPTTPPTVAVPISPPTVSTFAPMVLLTAAPISVPTTTPSLKPTMRPSNANDDPNTGSKSVDDANTSESSSSSSTNVGLIVGIVVGCFGGGFGIAALVGLFLMSSKKRNRNNDTPDYDDTYKHVRTSDRNRNHPSYPPPPQQHRMSQQNNNNYHPNHYPNSVSESTTENDFMTYATPHNEVPPGSPATTAYTTNTNGSNNNNLNRSRYADEEEEEQRYKRDFSVYMVHPDAFPAAAASKSPPPPYN